MKVTEVIRCEECKYWQRNRWPQPFRGNKLASICKRIKGMHITRDHDYCSFAERRGHDE